MFIIAIVGSIKSRSRESIKASSAPDLGRE